MPIQFSVLIHCSAFSNPELIYWYLSLISSIAPDFIQPNVTLLQLFQGTSFPICSKPFHDYSQHSENKSPLSIGCNGDCNKTAAILTSPTPCQKELIVM
uniref:Uncharacterized protein n=1 Tax=Pyxicephalus adspersus TaxID=30357 RepID=A0AAV2ZYP8_PYXAD|nr:TPA: hypothetical protein GDO54_017273 [Pyxicephalus adspersus]